MNIEHLTIAPSDNGPDPWDISVSDGSIYVDNQSLSIPSEDATIVLDESEQLTVLDDSTDLVAHIAWYESDTDELRILQFKTDASSTG